MDKLTKESVIRFMAPTYASRMKCPFMNAAPCMGKNCPKWHEVLAAIDPMIKKRTSYGKCTVVVFLKPGEKLSENLHIDPRNSAKSGD